MWGGVGGLVWHPAFPSDGASRCVLVGVYSIAHTSRGVHRKMV